MKAFDKSDFIQTWINQNEYYRVGYNKSTKDKIIVVTITWIAWYDIYFKLTDEEYEWHKNNISALTDLAQRMAIDKGENFYKDKLLLNEGHQK